MNTLNTAYLALAAKTNPDNKAAAKAALKAAGLVQARFQDLLDCVQYIKVQRNARNVRRGIKPSVAASSTPKQRLDALRRKAVLGLVVDSLRTGQRDTVSVRLTADPARVGITQQEVKEWNFYSGAHKNHPMLYKQWTVTVPADWRVRVQRRGLAVVDGMMTLDAAALEAAGCELFAATWAMQGRGCNVSICRGYIARSGGTSYHAETINLALTGIARKSRSVALTTMLAAADLSDLVSAAGSLSVSVSDARLTGSCEYGIKSWCNTVGLPYTAGAAPIAQVYAAYLREPRAEARAAILHALRRSRKLNASSVPTKPALAEAVN